MNAKSKWGNGVGIPEKKCRRCGRNFVPAPEHRFKEQIGGTLRYYCSWTCYNHRKDKTEERDR